VRPSRFHSRTTAVISDDDLFALAEHGGVDEVGERLGVERGVPADDHERVVGAALSVWTGTPARSIMFEHVRVDELGSTG
jgi:hypothetical protein